MMSFKPTVMAKNHLNVKPTNKDTKLKFKILIRWWNYELFTR